MNGVILAVAGAAILAASDAASKWLAASYPVGQVLFARGVVAIPFVLLLAHLGGGMRMLRVVNTRGQLFRAGLDVSSTFLLVLGLALLPFVDVTIIMAAGPLFVAALAGIVLGEYVGWRRWLAVTAGFAGVAVIVAPDGDAAARWAILIPLCATVCGAMRDLWTRRLLPTETAVATLAVGTIALTAAGLMTLPTGWLVPSGKDFAMMALAGILLVASQYLFIEAFRRSEATLVAPLKYTTIVWATGIGAVVWGERPTMATWIGAVLIVVSGYYLIRRSTPKVGVL